MNRRISRGEQVARQLPELRYAIPHQGRTVSPLARSVIAVTLAILRQGGHEWRWLTEGLIIVRCQSDVGLSRETLRGVIDTMVEDGLLERPTTGDPLLVLLTSSSMARTRV